jgi:GT2 family glycosyltransferase
MFRRDAYEQIGGYREVTGTWEDLSLCVRLARAGRVLVIPQALYWCRFHATSLTNSVGVAAAVESAIARAAALEPGGSPPSAASAGALLELNSMQLWSGSRPAHLEALRAAARACGARRQLVLLAWARWAETSPNTLRSGLRWRSRLRDQLATAWIPAKRPHEWHPG